MEVGYGWIFIIWGWSGSEENLGVLVLLESLWVESSLAELY